MVELEQTPPSDCCSPDAQETCCEPTDKAKCCGESAKADAAGCGCDAA